MTIPREMLYPVDDIFFTGTAAEITPVRSVDRLPVGEGKRARSPKPYKTSFSHHLRPRRDKWNRLTPVTLPEPANALHPSHQALVCFGQVVCYNSHMKGAICRSFIPANNQRFLLHIATAGNTVGGMVALT